MDTCFWNPRILQPTARLAKAKSASTIGEMPKSEILMIGFQTVSTLRPIGSSTQRMKTNRMHANWIHALRHKIAIHGSKLSELYS